VAGWPVRWLADGLGVAGGHAEPVAGEGLAQRRPGGAQLVGGGVDAAEPLGELEGAFGFGPVGQEAAGLPAHLASQVVDGGLQEWLGSLNKAARLRHTAHLGHGLLDKLKGSQMGDGHGHPQGSGRRDFFVSYTGADLPWARWIAWELEAADYATVFQEWDFPAGANFVLEMHRAAHQTHRTVAVLSQRYLDALFTQPEWAAALVSDPTAVKRRLVPVRIEDCRPGGLLQGIIYIDLVGLEEPAARQRLREGMAGTLRGRSTPATAPVWPSPSSTVAPGGEPAAIPAAVRPRFATVLPPIWNIPYRRNPAFTGREAELLVLACQLGQVRTAAVTQAIQGGGGIGKTTLAAEYAWRYRSNFEVVWWVRAEEPASLVGDYAELAAALGLPEAALPEQQAVVQAVRRWLETHDRWLLVLDNAEGPQTDTGLLQPLAHLVDLLPQAIANHGQVLVTTRDASWEQQTALMDLDLLSGVKC
jgi:hypothetical protein